MSAKSAVSVWNCSWTTTKRSSRSEPAAHGVLLGRHRGRVRVVDEERLHRRLERRVGQDAPELAHVEGARPRGDEVGPLEGGRVHREGARGGEERAAADVAPGPDHRREARDRPDRHAAPGVPVQAVVEAEGRGPRRRVLAGERLDLLRPQAGHCRRPGGGPLERPLAQLLVADRVEVEPLPVLEPVAEGDVHHPQGERGVGARVRRQVAGRTSPRCASGRGRRTRAAPRASSPPRRTARGARSS